MSALTERTEDGMEVYLSEIHECLDEFSGNLAVVKTRPGYAMGIASDIDSHAPSEILATIAGDDTILVIPRNGVSQEKVIAALSHFI